MIHTLRPGTKTLALCGASQLFGGRRAGLKFADEKTVANCPDCLRYEGQPIHRRGDGWRYSADAICGGVKGADRMDPRSTTRWDFVDCDACWGVRETKCLPSMTLKIDVKYPLRIPHEAVEKALREASASVAVLTAHIPGIEVRATVTPKTKLADRFKAENEARKKR